MRQLCAEIEYDELGGQFRTTKSQGRLFVKRTPLHYQDEDRLPELTNAFRHQVVMGSKATIELLSAANGLYEAPEISALIASTCSVALSALNLCSDQMALDKIGVAELSYFQMAKITHESLASMRTVHVLSQMPDFKAKEEQIYQRMNEIRDYWEMLYNTSYRTKINNENRRLYSKSGQREPVCYPRSSNWLAFTIAFVAIITLVALAIAFLSRSN